jgi:acetylornithine/N-succinyldiaminopimelate aminotransferase
MSALFQTYPPFPFVLDRGEGDRVFAADGRSWFDFYGGHCVASTGHGHPRVVEAIANQARRLLFYSVAGEMQVRHHAADALLAFAAGVGLEKVFFCNSGAEANENALKIAHQLTGRRRVLSTIGGWHGRTLGCLAVTDDPPIVEPQADWLLPNSKIQLNDLAALEQVPWHQFAAVIVEPIQSMSGIRVADRAWLQALAAKARAHGTLLILDEIQTGVGRLGTPFAAHHYGVSPDLITSAKGLASGVPIGAVLMTGAIAAALKPKDLGSTFGGSPLACAALLATLEVLADEHLLERAVALEARIRSGLAGNPAITGVRGIGLLLGLVAPEAKTLKDFLFNRGILLGGASDPTVLRLMPPLTLSDVAVDSLLAACSEFAAPAKSPPSIGVGETQA